jgi:hypothetical protein
VVGVLALQLESSQVVQFQSSHEVTQPTEAASRRPHHPQYHLVPQSLEFKEPVEDPPSADSDTAYCKRERGQPLVQLSTSLLVLDVRDCSGSSVSGMQRQRISLAI